MNKKNLIFASMMALSLMSTTSCDNEKVLKIGVLQYVNDPALNNAYSGFESIIKEGLKQEYEIDLKIAAADSATNTTGAESLINNCDIVLGIATPSAIALQTACYLQQKDTPILFTAVTDPVSCGLVSNANKPGANVTGTTDMNPVADQIALVKQIKPNATKIGITYTTSEQNSIIQKNLAKAKCDDLGLTLVDKAFSTISELSASLTALKNEKIDALYIPTDNNCANNITTIMGELKDTGILVVAGEANMLTGGAHVSLGVDYFKLGEETGRMALEILNNKVKPGDLAVRGASEFPLYVNQSSLNEFKITVTADFVKDAIIKNTGE